MMAVVACLCFLNGAGGLDDPAVRAVMECAHRECKSDDASRRLLVLQSVPGGDSDAVKRALVKAIRSISDTARLQPEDIFLGRDPNKGDIKISTKTTVSKSGKEMFVYRKNFDENGIM